MEVVILDNNHKSVQRCRISSTRSTRTEAAKSTLRNFKQLLSMAKGKTFPTKPVLWWFQCLTRTNPARLTSLSSRNSSTTWTSGWIASKLMIATNLVPSKKLSLVRLSLRWVSALASSSFSSWSRSTTQQRGKSLSISSSSFAWKSSASRTHSVNVTRSNRAQSPSDSKIFLELHWTAPTKTIRLVLASATASTRSLPQLYSFFLPLFQLLQISIGLNLKQEKQRQARWWLENTPVLMIQKKFIVQLFPFKYFPKWLKITKVWNNFIFSSMYFRWTKRTNQWNSKQSQ